MARVTLRLGKTFIYFYDDAKSSLIRMFDEPKSVATCSETLQKGIL